MKLREQIFYSIPSTTIMHIHQTSNNINLIVIHLGLKIGIPKLGILILLFLI